MKTTTKVLSAVALLLLIVLVFSVFPMVGSTTHSAPPWVAMEMMDLWAALETYRSLHGHYPSDPATTERLGPNTTGDPAAYVSSSEYLYRALSDDLDPNGKDANLLDGKGYYELKPEMLRRTSVRHVYFADPNGNSYGYSTLKAVHPESADGNNPSYDLWSTCGHTRLEDKQFWHRNWPENPPR